MFFSRNIDGVLKIENNYNISPQNSQIKKIYKSKINYSSKTPLGIFTVKSVRYIYLFFPLSIPLRHIKYILLKVWW